MPRKNGPAVSGDNKCCHSCSSVKTTAEFYGNRSKPDGLTSQCKDCIRLDQEAALKVKAILNEVFSRMAARNSEARMLDLVGLDLELAA